MISIPEMRNTMKAMAHIMPSLFPPNSNPYLQLVYDFIQCFQLQDTPEPRIVCDAIMVAVDNGTRKLKILRTVTYMYIYVYHTFQKIQPF
jgi:hypothetical protein